MSIRVLRAPSESPNINNTDDFPGLRYAYGNQNGYIKGKGEELSYTINGSTLKIGSGRIVLQGVECDIDANGVSITVDNVASTRSYVVYLEVSLLSDTAAVKAVYDTSIYPDVDPGDDLNENTTGTARMVLYQFHAISGTISGVSKKIKELGYYPDIVAELEYDVFTGTLRAGNAKTAEAIANQEVVVTEDGNVITVGGKRMTRHRVLFAGERTYERTGSTESIALTEEINDGDVIAVGVGFSNKNVVGPILSEDIKLVTLIAKKNISGNVEFQVKNCDTGIETEGSDISPYIEIAVDNFAIIEKRLHCLGGAVTRFQRPSTWSRTETGSVTIKNVYKLYM